MLVLSRKLNERIVIGDGTTCPRIEILVVEIAPGKIRLGITAPRDVPVLRSELVREDSRHAPDSGAM